MPFLDHFLEKDETYFNTYAEAVQYALDHAEKKGFTYDEDEYFSIVATGSKKPSAGKTTSWKLPLLKGEKATKKMLVVSVYHRDDANSKPFELTYYIS